METLQLLLVGYVVAALVITITTARALRQDPWWFYLLWFAVAPLAVLVAIVGWALTKCGPVFHVFPKQRAFAPLSGAAARGRADEKPGNGPQHTLSGIDAATAQAYQISCAACGRADQIHVLCQKCLSRALNAARDVIGIVLVAAFVVSHMLLVAACEQ